MTSNDSITVVSNGRLKNHGRFGWAAAIKDEVVMIYGGKVKGSAGETSSFWSEATGMLSVVYVLNTKFRCSIWTDNEALVVRMKRMIEYDPISTNLKNDPDLYCGLQKLANQIEIKDVEHVKGHQDKTGRALSMVEKRNGLADKLASKAISKERCK